jgi:hypothetical protein
MVRLCLLWRHCFQFLYRSLVLSSTVIRPSKLLLLQQLISPSLKAYPPYFHSDVASGLNPLVWTTRKCIAPRGRPKNVEHFKSLQTERQSSYSVISWLWWTDTDKGNFVLEQAMKAQRGSRSKRYSFFNFSNGWCGCLMPRPGHITPRKETGYPFDRRLGRTQGGSGRLWTLWQSSPVGYQKPVSVR